jgi:microcystin-dependent protein
VGWTAQSPDRFKELATLVASLLSGTITASFLTGKIGGSAPTSDVGPWQNGDEWWFWDPTTHQYWPSEQGAPVGAMMMWGTQPVAAIPPRWLLCKGQNESASIYPRLFQAIGYTWGGSGDSFWLPPAAVMFVNAPNWNPPAGDPNYDDSQSPDGSIAIFGGSQVAALVPTNIPPAKISIPIVKTQMITGNTLEPNIQTPGLQYLYPVTDEHGVPLGTNQQSISVMPPFVTVHYVMKYM